MTRAESKSKLLFKAHPWHGVSVGSRFPEELTAFIEIVPTDTVKYELDKHTGLLKIDRPQRFSNICPAPYGLVPQTFCGDNVAALMARRAGRQKLVGDGDPLDICVLTEKVISHSGILLEAVPIGGLSMIDGEEADDKIVAVMKEDAVYGSWQEIDECPKAVIQRLQHYFLTYKRPPGSETNKCEIIDVYGRATAHQVLLASREDYKSLFGNVTE